jgi:hypothetical protein
MKRIFAIAGIWIGCALGWVVLGSTLVVRSGESSAALSPEVHQLWGPPLEQQQPHAAFTDVRMRESTRTLTDSSGRVSTETSQQPESVQVPAPLRASDITVALELEHRQRGLVWFPTFAADFRGRYTFENADASPRTVTFTFPLQSEHAVYDGFSVRDASGSEVAVDIAEGSASWRAELASHERATYEIAYRTRGTGTWQYRMGYGTSSVDDFRLAMTADFDDVDFPAGTLSPTRHGAHRSGWRGEWRFTHLIANRPIGIEPPARINPGPLASRITFFAPVGLLFFFFVVAILGGAQRRELHPVHFFFLGCSFFAFHLLFAYLVDHLSIAISFGVSTAVSMALAVSYARLFVGWRFALVEIALSQLIYLVLFSSTFLLEGFTGLAITVGAILTLFVMMQITGRKRAAKAEEPVTTLPTAPPPGQTAQPVTF